MWSLQEKKISLDASTSVIYIFPILSVFSPSFQVTMADRSAADRACKDPNPIIDGRKANVNLAYLGAKPRVMQPGKDSRMKINKTQKIRL